MDITVQKKAQSYRLPIDLIERLKQIQAIKYLKGYSSSY